MERRPFSLTVLTAKNRWACHAKTYGPDGQLAGPRPDTQYYHKTYHLPLRVSALADFLAIQMQDRRSILLHGKVADNAPEIIHRRSVKNGGQVEHVPSYLLCIDIDDLPLPQGLDMRIDTEAAARYVLAELARHEPVLGKTTCIIMPSNSAGQPGKEGIAKFHFFFLLDKPALPGARVNGKKNGLRYGWVARINHLFREAHGLLHGGANPAKLIDDALFNSIQPLSIALPVMKKRAEDPIPADKRLFIIKGEQELLQLPADAEEEFMPPRSGTAISTNRPAGKKRACGGLKANAGFQDHLAAIQAGMAAGSSQPMIFQALRAGMRNAYLAGHDVHDNDVLLANAEAVRNALEAAPVDERYEERLQKYTRDDLIRQARNAADRVLDDLEPPEGIGLLNPWGHEIIRINEPRLPALPMANGWDAVKSGMGSGKTQQAKQLIKAYDDHYLATSGRPARVLVVVHRQSLAKAATSRLDLKCYLDKDIDPRRETRLVICANSLHRLRKQNFDLIILEESDQLFRHLGHLKAKDCVRTNMEQVRLVVGRAHQVVAVDAQLSDLTLRNMERLRPGERGRIIINTHATPKTVRVFPTRNEVVAAAFTRIEAGAKVYIATNGKRAAQDLYQEVRRRFPEKQGEVVTSDNSADPGIRELLEDVNQRGADLDYIIASPSISSGVSIDEIPFEVFGIFDSGINAYTDAWQALHRVRQATVLNVWVAQGTPPAGVSPEEIQRWRFEAAQAAGAVTADLFAGELVVDAFFSALWTEVMQFERYAKGCMRALLLRLARADGCEVEFVMPDTAAADEGKAIRQSGREAADEARNRAIVDAPILCSFQADQLRDAQNVTSEERLQLERYDLCEFYIVPSEQLTEEIVAEDRRGQRRREVRRMELAQIGWYEAVSFDADDRADQEGFAETLRHRSEGRRLLREFLEHLRFDPDFLVWKGQPWTAADLGPVVRWFQDNRVPLAAVQIINLGDDLRAKPQKYVGQLLKSMGIRLRSTKQGPRGAQVRLYAPDSETLTELRRLLQCRKEVRFG